MKDARLSWWLVTLVLVTLGCSKSKPISVAQAAPPAEISVPSVAPVVPSCTDSLRGSLTKISPASTIVLDSSMDVLWQVRLVGGCTSNYRLVGQTANIQDGYQFTKKYLVANAQVESISVAALKADGSIFQSIDIRSLPFDVRAPPPNILTCQAVLDPSVPIPPGSGSYNPATNIYDVKIDILGNIQGALPELAYNISFTLDGVPTTGHVTSIASIDITKPVDVLRPSPLLVNDSNAVGTTLRFRKTGSSAVIVNATRGTGVAACFITLNVSGSYTPPALTLVANPTTVDYNASSFLSWSAIGNALACQILKNDTILFQNGLTGNNISTGALTVTTSYTLRCDQGTPVTVSVVVRAAPPTDPVLLTSGLSASAALNYENYRAQNLVDYNSPFFWNSGVEMFRDGLIYVTVDLGAGYSLNKVIIRLQMTPAGHQKWLIQVAGSNGFNANETTILTRAETFTAFQELEAPVGSSINAQYGGGIRYVRVIAQDDGQFSNSWIALNKIYLYRNP